MPHNRSLLDTITFAQLRAFECVAREGSFAKAAETLDIAQPSVSEQVANLEARLGRLLFLRRRGTTPVLTRDGEEMLAIVREILTAAQNLFAPTRNSVGKPVVRISVGHYLRQRFLIPAMPKILRDNPGIEVELYPLMASPQARRQIEEGILDLAIYSVPELEDVWPGARKVCDVPMIMCAQVGTSEKLKDGTCKLEDFRYVFPIRREFGERWALQRLRALNLPYSVEPEFVEFVDVVPHMVEDGQVIAFMITEAVERHVEAGRMELLDYPVPAWHRIIGRANNPTQAVLAVEQYLCEAMSVT